MRAGACTLEPQPQTVVRFLAQVLGIELRSSRRAASTTNHWATSPGRYPF